MQTSPPSAGPTPTRHPRNARRPVVPRPLPLRAVDAVGRAIGGIGWRGVDFTEDVVHAAARRATGLSDFGDARYREGLGVLIESLERDARLSPFGRFFAKSQLVDALGHRLTMTDYRQRHPAVAAEKIERPIFVVGLPRTGTTLLQELLAQDPAHRGLRSWELDDPCPPTEANLADDDARVVRAERRFSALRHMAPGFQAIHPIGAQMAQECLVATAYAFASVRFELCFDVTGYQAWLADQDLRFAYETHSQVLQHFQSKRPGQRWVLKSPGHLAAFDPILERYPDALLIQTHRDPQRVIPSVASLYANMRSIGTRDLRPESIGPQMVDVWARYLEEGIAQRARRSDAADQIQDVHFGELTRDPIGVVERIYRQFGLTFTSEARQAMQAYLDANPRHRFGVHRYDHESFGLDPMQIAERFAAYNAHFDIPIEGDA